MKEVFRRINYFKGFFIQAEDLQNAQQYHVEKRKLHNRFLHTPGVVRGCFDNLNVSASEDGTLIYIAPGCAIDWSGREIYNWRTIKEPLNPQDHTPPGTIYVLLGYNEEEDKDSLRPDPANPELSDYAFIKEIPKVQITTTEPNSHEAVELIELARIRLAADATRVRNPGDPDNPTDNEIDRRSVQYAGAVIRPPKLEELGRIIKDQQIAVAPNPERVFSAEDTNVLLEKIRDETTQPFYMVSVRPIEPGHITWRIDASATRAAVEYRLFFNNWGERTAKVAYRVYRLD
jgi:hypothetical protein